MSINNDSVDQLAATYAQDEQDTKAYIKAQQATIISQTKQINELRKFKEQLEGEVGKLQMENIQLKALNPTGVSYEVSDEEVICVTQLAILKNLAMSRELTLEEVKKAEILTKVVIQIRGKPADDDSSKPTNLSNEDLIAMMKTMGEA